MTRVYFYKRTRGGWATCRNGHRFKTRRCHQCRRVSVDPNEGVKCLACGEVMRSLAGHLKSHGLTAEAYRAQFPGASIVGAIMQDIRRDIHIDQAENGTSPLKRYERKERAPRKKRPPKMTEAQRRKKRAARQRDYYKRNQEARLAYRREYYLREGR